MNEDLFVVDGIALFFFMALVKLPEFSARLPYGATLRLGAKESLASRA